jgi:hypothetical protein
VLILISSLIVAGAIVWAARLIAGAAARDRQAPQNHRANELSLLQLFAPALTAVQGDPRALLVWQPLADAARREFPEAFAALDRAFAGAFPFSSAQIEGAHARWTAEWLAWEAAHDAAYKLKATEVEHDPACDRAVARARLHTLEREKLEMYQRRYEEYVRVAKALQALRTAPPA